MKKRNLEDFLGYLLKEDNFVPQPQSSFEVRPVEQAKDVSLDQVIDRYIVRYEREAIPTLGSYEDELFREDHIPSIGDVILEALNEAGEEKDEDAIDEPEVDAPADSGAADAGGDDAPAEPFGSDLASTTDIGSGASAGSNADKQHGQPVVATPQINLQEFAKNIARLINNYDVLLNPKNTILNRVEKYVQTNYDKRTAEEFMEILDVNYSLRTKERDEENNEEFPTPYAAGALGSEG